MSITAGSFHETGWRIVREDACIRFRTSSFAASVELIEAIGRQPDPGGRFPDIELRSGHVTVRIASRGPIGLLEEDVALARRISAVARELGAAIDLSGLQAVQIAIDALVIPEVRPFWRAVLGYEEIGEEDLADPVAESPPVWFQQMDEPRPQRNRIHVDIYVAHDEAEARVRAGLAAGGHVANDANAPGWWTLADAEGNEADIAPWPDDPARQLSA